MRKERPEHGSTRGEVRNQKDLQVLKKKAPLLIATIMILTAAFCGLFAFHSQPMNVEAGATSSSWDGLPAAGFSGGNGTPGAPYQISTAGELKYLSNLVYSDSGYRSACYELTQDIELNDLTLVNVWSEGLAPQNKWTPIGTTAARCFSGTFNGNGHVISGIYISTDTSNQGLFGYVSGGSILNVSVEQSYVRGGDYYVGGIVGYANLGSTIAGCYNAGQITGGSRIGGIAGQVTGQQVAGQVLNGCVVTGCYNTGTISGSGNYVGGVAGQALDGSVITLCYNTGTISGSDSVGGVAGLVNVSSGVINSYNAGTISGNSNVGGVVGQLNNLAFMINSYNTGSVSGSAPTNAYAGGVVGNMITSNVTNCYNTAQVTGSIRGSLIGRISGGSISYYYIES